MNQANTKAQFIAGFMHCCKGDDFPCATAGMATEPHETPAFERGFNTAWVRIHDLPLRQDACLPVAEAAYAEEEAHAASVARIDARMAEGLCCVSYDGRQFTCNNRVSAENLAHGCAVCDACAQKADEREGYCDGEAQRRMEGWGE